mgnify:FL=1
MASIQTVLRDELITQVNADKSGYVNTQLECEAAFIPQEKIEDLIDHPKAKFVAVGFEGERERSYRSGSAFQIIPIQVAIQQKVAPFIVPVIDVLVELAEQVQNSCENDFQVGSSRYNWLRTIPLRDDNGLTYTYQQLSQQGIFQAIFTVHFSYVVERNC